MYEKRLFNFVENDHWSVEEILTFSTPIIKFDKRGKIKNTD